MKVIINLTRKDLRIIRDDCRKHGCGDCPSEHICTEIYRFKDVPTPEDWDGEYIKQFRNVSGVKHGLRYEIKIN